MERKISRRQFLELCAGGLTSVAFNPSQALRIILEQSIKMAEAEEAKIILSSFPI
jgi:hypothetical protein